MRKGSPVLVAPLLLAAMCVAWAQVPGGSDPRRGGPAPTGARPSAMPPAGDERVATPNLAELVQLRMSQLEEDLNLKPAQLPLWNGYRDRVLRLLEDTRREARTITASAVDATAPKRLDALGDTARNRLAAVEDIVDAGKALYAALTPQQQVIADRRLALPLATLTGADAGAGDPRRAPGAPSRAPEGKPP